MACQAEEEVNSQNRHLRALEKALVCRCLHSRVNILWCKDTGLGMHLTVSRFVRLKKHPA